MSFIVNLAKELGFTPNPNMTLKEAKIILQAIKQALKNSMPVNKQHKINNDTTLKEMIYTFQKQVERQTNISAYQSAVSLFQNPPDGLICKTQIGTTTENGFNPTGNFVWQTVPNRPSAVERFTCDIDICSPHFPTILGKLRHFILKYQGGFKIPYFGHEDRSDTLNCYMTKPITPEIASEFYQIIAPCLNTDFHDKLDGLPVYANGQIIKGIKIGPEYTIGKDKQKNQETANKLYQLTQQSKQGLPQTFQGQYIFLTGSSNRPDCSLGQKSAEIETHNLLYYLAGLEGKSPLKLMNSTLSDIYAKKLDIGIFLNKNNNKYTPVMYNDKTEQPDKADNSQSTNNTAENSNDTPSPQAIHLWAFKASPYFDVKNGLLYLKEDLSDFDKTGIQQLKLKETLNISARPLKNKEGNVYAYAPTTINKSKQWLQLLQAVQSQQRQGQPKQISQEDARHIATIASHDFKVAGHQLLFRDLENKQPHSGINAYGSHNSLIGLLRDKYNIYYIPIHEKGTCTGFKIIGDKSRSALQHLFTALNNLQKNETICYTNTNTSTSFGR